MTRFVSSRNTHQEESHVASQTAVNSATRIAFIKKYLASGLTQREFCQQEKLAYPTFLAWLRKHRAALGQAPNSNSTASRFVALQLEPSARRAASCTLEFPNGILVHFSGDIDAQLLTCLLRAIEDKS
jgi:hypothetical protein